MRKAIAASALALACAAGSLVLAPTASAAPDACRNVVLITGDWEDDNGSQALKSATSTCSDLNLTEAQNLTATTYDWYAGRLYYTSTSTWKTCSAGYLRINNGTYATDTYVLCSSVKDNARFSVDSWFGGGDRVVITH
ncbi:hypothetical protein [Streptomyces geranii]|uniref:hypothetical protein n=1 Tax=Streptomyces geranii TaxID=2058923 RepID=UPI000D042276|nr:hypothetical protein [Streptomyces geranii]